MQSRLFATVALATSFLIGSSAAIAADNPASNPTANDISGRLLHELRSYPYYSIFDDLGFQISGSQVVLTGDVTQPVKKSDIENIARTIPGVTSVQDDIKVLPLSDFDNRLRQQIAVAIYRYPALNKYAYGPFPAIHIIVDNGHVTLTGFVDTQTDKNLAGLRANGAGLSFGQVVNNLQVAQPAAAKKS